MDSGHDLATARAVFSEFAQHDADRYVTAYAAEIVHRVNHREAMIWELGNVPAGNTPVLIRWCCMGDGWDASARRLTKKTALQK